MVQKSKIEEIVRKESLTRKNEQKGGEVGDERAESVSGVGIKEASYRCHGMAF
jgi:hypothetical protein